MDNAIKGYYQMKYFLLLSFLTILLKKSKTAKTSPFPSFHGVIKTAHSIDGRVRFLIPKLKNNTVFESKLKNDLKKIDFLSSISTSTVSGSLILEYDYKEVEPFFLFITIVKVAGLEDEIYSNKDSKLSTEFTLIKESASRAIYEKTHGILDLKSSFIFLLFLAMFYYSLNKNKTMVPQFTLAFWLFNLI